MISQFFIQLFCRCFQRLIKNTKRNEAVASIPHRLKKVRSNTSHAYQILERKEMLTVAVNATFDENSPFGFDLVSSYGASWQVVQRENNKELSIVYDQDETEVKLEKELDTKSVDISFETRFTTAPPVNETSRGFVGIKLSRLLATANGETTAHMQNELHLFRVGNGPDFTVDAQTYIAESNVLDNVPLTVPLTEKFTVRYFAKLNTPGIEDGVFIVWLNGNKVAEHRNVIWGNSPGTKFTYAWVGGNISFGGEVPARPIDRRTDNVVIVIDAEEPFVDPSPLPILTVSNSSVLEGNTGFTKIRFPFTLSKPSLIQTSFGYGVASGSASIPSDLIAQSGTVSIPVGAKDGFFELLVNGDWAVEPNETFLVNLTNAKGIKLSAMSAIGTILNDDFSTPSRIFVDDSTQFEDIGFLNFTLRLDRPSSGQVSVDFRSVNGTAKSPQDYQAISGKVTFSAGSTVATVRVNLTTDQIDENNENFKLILSNPVGASLADSIGIATIKNDDKWISIVRFPEANWFEKNEVTGETRVTQFGWDGDIPLRGIFDSSGIFTQASYRDREGKIYIRFSNGSAIALQVATPNSDLIPMVADFRGNGIYDLMLYNRDSSAWTLVNLQTGQTILSNAVFGQMGDIPMVGKMNGSGRAYMIAFRFSNGTAYIMDPLNFGNGGWVVGNGWHGSIKMPDSTLMNRPIPVIGDLDGDGIEDFSLVGETDALWSTFLSSTGTLSQKYFGIAGSIPVVIDIDSDGVGDRTMIDKRYYNWYFDQSSTKTTKIVQWGLPWTIDWIPFDFTYYARRKIWGR